MHIEVKNIYKKYNNIDIIRNFSCLLPKQTITALMGPSGCGKTTLTRILLGLEKADEGEIIGLENKLFACVFQQDRLSMGHTAFQNIQFVMKQKGEKEKIGKALYQVGLTEQDIYKPVKQLSGGQKRRVALVRAMEAESEFIVLDEAFKGLDEISKKLAYTYMLEKAQGKTVLLVTHDKQEADLLASKIISLPVTKVDNNI